jgi:hypothetical protein
MITWDADDLGAGRDQSRRKQDINFAELTDLIVYG